MNERTEIPSRADERSGRLRFELIFASIWLAIGLFALPALIFWVGSMLLGPYGEGTGAGVSAFYGDFFADLASGQLRAWGLTLGPLALVTMLRAVFTNFGARPRPEHDEPVAPAASQPGPERNRRVEPRIGAD